MNYNIKGTDLPITPELRAYVEKKLTTLEKFLSDVSASRADVELEFLRAEAGRYRAEIMLHVPHHEPLRAEATGSALHEAIDIAVGELSSELTRGKKKRLHLLRRGSGKIKDMLRGLSDRF